MKHLIRQYERKALTLMLIPAGFHHVKAVASKNLWLCNFATFSSYLLDTSLPNFLFFTYPDPLILDRFLVKFRTYKNDHNLRTTYDIDMILDWYLNLTKWNMKKSENSILTWCWQIMKISAFFQFAINLK